MFFSVLTRYSVYIYFSRSAKNFQAKKIDFYNVTIILKEGLDLSTYRVNSGENIIRESYQHYLKSLMHICLDLNRQDGNLRF